MKSDLTLLFLFHSISVESGELSFKKRNNQRLLFLKAYMHECSNQEAIAKISLEYIKLSFQRVKYLLFIIFAVKLSGETAVTWPDTT